MNYLALCQRVNDVVGFQGQVNSVATDGYQAVLTTSVKEAYEDIQRYRKDWDWLRGTKEVNVGPGTEEYTLETLWGSSTPDLAEYYYITYVDSNGKTQPLKRYTYDSVQLLEDEDPSEPRWFTNDPVTQALIINPVDVNYTLKIYYFKKLHQLTANTSIPLLPDRHHQLIVYGAVMKLSSYVGNATLFDTYSVKYAEELGQLMREKNPAKTIRKRPIA